VTVNRTSVASARGGAAAPERPGPPRRDRRRGSMATPTIHRRIAALFVVRNVAPLSCAAGVYHAEIDASEKKPESKRRAASSAVELGDRGASGRAARLVPVPIWNDRGAGSPVRSEPARRFRGRLLDGRHAPETSRVERDLFGKRGGGERREVLAARSRNRTLRSRGR